jgi:hypothetical protein
LRFLAFSHGMVHALPWMCISDLGGSTAAHVRARGRRLITEEAMSRLVSGIFPSRASAEHAVDELVAAGFSENDVSLLMSDTTRGREFVVHKGTKTPEAAATGATVGGVIGAIAAGLAAVGTLVVPGLSLVAAGPIVAALAGLGAGAAAGGLTGALVGMGIPEHEAKFAHKEIEKGGILVGVYTHDDRAKIARQILDSSGAEHISKQ